MAKYIKAKCEDCDGDGLFNGTMCTTCCGKGFVFILNVEDGEEEEQEIEKYWINDLYKIALRVTANNIHGVSFFRWNKTYQLGGDVNGDWCYAIAMGESTGYKEVSENEFIKFIKNKIESEKLNEQC